jgi:predicted nucleic acid-binding protein
MIAADTSSLVAYFGGGTGDDVDKIAHATSASELALPPAVVTELLSDPSAGPILESLVSQIATLSISEGYWLRAARTRRLVQSRRLKAKVADALIAQSCIDHDLALITRDRDFRHFAKHCGLRLA